MSIYTGDFLTTQNMTTKKTSTELKQELIAMGYAVDTFQSLEFMAQPRGIVKKSEYLQMITPLRKKFKYYKKCFEELEIRLIDPQYPLDLPDMPQIIRGNLHAIPAVLGNKEQVLGQLKIVYKNLQEVTRELERIHATTEKILEDKEYDQYIEKARDLELQRMQAILDEVLEKVNGCI
jgi:hypothetical protein